MCGIGGVLSWEPIPRKWLSDLSNVMQHRGPDDEGVKWFQSDGAYLGLVHRRLTILDLSSMGRQPMAYGDDLWIVFNGEIYNYVELREELAGQGFNFKSQTDTEVVLASYRHWGTGCVSRFNGMWAFVLYDRRNRLLFGARDRFGVKPLYYHQSDDRFAFASEIKGLLTLPFVPKEVNPPAVFDYLVLGTEGQRDPFFRHIDELMPANAFVYDLSGGGFRRWQYFDLNVEKRWAPFSLKACRRYAEAVRHHVYQAVRLRLRSDVPVGSCLSGGVDSSTIVCVLNELLKERANRQVGDRQRVFTASYPSLTVDESPWAEKVVRATDARWHRVFPDAGTFLEDLEDLVHCQDVPFGSTSIYAQYRVMKLARQTGVKVLLDGQGGDELFTGYPGYYRALFAQIIRNVDLTALFREARHLNRAPLDSGSLVASLLKLGAASLLPRYAARCLAAITRRARPYIRREFWHAFRIRLDAVQERLSSNLNTMLHEDMTRSSLQTLLKYEDRNSMRFSVEARTPFADDIDLIEYVFKVPGIYKIHRGMSKFLLRRAMDDIVPGAILERTDKLGFVTPETLWFRQSGQELCSYLDKKIQGIVDVTRFVKAFRQCLQSAAPFDTRLFWRFVNLAVWLRTFDLSAP